MDKTKEEFVHFIKDAMADRNCDAFIELYQFLLGCYVRADTDLDGKVSVEEFDGLIEEAAALPRKYGFAPKTADLFPNESARKTARAKMFSDIDIDKDGFLTFEEWMRFSEKHIFSKAATLPKDPLVSPNATKEEFVAFIKKAIDRKTPEYRSLYHFLLKCFVDADKDRDGSVNPSEFDIMIEEAAQAPRRFGLAPQTKDLFKTDADRLAARVGYFQTMDTNNDGKISFDEWLNYAVTHIIGKAATV